MFGGSSQISSGCTTTSIDEDDYDVWSYDIGRHASGEFSLAVSQANRNLQDFSQVEIGRDITFVGVYDGHLGPDAARFVSQHLFLNFVWLARESRTISEDTLNSAFAATEAGFLAHVEKAHQTNPPIITTGSCCLVGVVWRGTLYVANLGDSRTVIGCADRYRGIISQQLTRDHNAREEEVRKELKSHHPDDRDIVSCVHGKWLIKGTIKVSRSIGDAYLKKREFSNHPRVSRYFLSEALRRPVLSAEPSIYRRALSPQDRFLIFASHGLWEHLTNQAAVDIVQNHPRAGIAKRLVSTAIRLAVRKAGTFYTSTKAMPKVEQHTCDHDDITVVVIYIDHELSWESNVPLPEQSVRGFIDAIAPSEISTLAGIKLK
ncbi:probable protein phosphatase 2C 25 [Typha latifolia]|uniref:probable protein phosphatase 2C 25 n=1 Tax=Typha latifolia TaxID=4733 RepID=UPI003C303609